MTKPADKLVFEMPNSLEDFLFCCLIVQEIQITMLVRQVKSEVTVACREDFEKIGRPALHPARIVRKLSDEDLASADMCIRFDRKRAWAVGSASHKHITESYGVMVGAASVTVPVIGEKLPTPPGGAEILWLPRHGSDWCAQDFIWEHLDEFMGTDGRIQALDSHIEPERAWEVISGAGICVGISGGLTTMAAAMGNPLVEICPPRLAHSNWTAKWGSPDYRMLTLNPEDLTVDRVWQSVFDIADFINQRSQSWASHLPSISRRKRVAA